MDVQNNNNVLSRNPRKAIDLAARELQTLKISPNLGPIIEFKGTVHYRDNLAGICLACETLLYKVDSSSDIVPVGFDLEWPVSYTTGPKKVALMQICMEVGNCYLFQISELSSLPQVMTNLFRHHNIRLTGVGVKNDVRKLARDFHVQQVDSILANCVDSGVLANSILPFQQRWSLDNLVFYLLGKKIDKNNKVRKSKWNETPLSHVQMCYAATDAYVSLMVYLDLKTRQQENAS